MEETTLRHGEGVHLCSNGDSYEGESLSFRIPKAAQVDGVTIVVTAPAN